MTKEQKQLLTKDLCARFPYGVKVRISSESDVCLYVTTDTLDIDNLHKYMLNGGYYKNGLFYKTPGFQLLPYLRPMSSMTEEEKAFLDTTKEIEYTQTGLTGKGVLTLESYDYLNSIHVDYRELIPMGLALEAPADMYKN